MNKRFIFKPYRQRDELCDWEIYLDFKRIGAIVIEAEDGELNLSWQICVKHNGEQLEKETDSRDGVLKFLEKVYASELAAPSDGKLFKDGKLAFKWHPPTDGWQAFVGDEQLPCHVFMKPCLGFLGVEFIVVTFDETCTTRHASASHVRTFLKDYFMKGKRS